MREPVAGTLRITATERTSGAKLVITGVLTAPGLDPTPVQHKVEVPSRKLAAVFRRYDLPVLVDRTDPSRLRFVWDEVPDEKQLDLLDAARLADRMREGAENPDGVVTDIAGLPGGLGSLLGNLADGRNVRVYTSTTTSTGGEVPPELADFARRMADQVGRAFGAPTPPEAAPHQDPTDATPRMPWDEPPTS